jgi:hypothetical protein
MVDVEVMTNQVDMVRAIKVIAEAYPKSKVQEYDFRFQRSHDRINLLVSERKGRGNPESIGVIGIGDPDRRGQRVLMEPTPLPNFAPTISGGVPNPSQLRMWILECWRASRDLPAPFPIQTIP